MAADLHIPLYQPTLSESELDAARQSLASGWIGSGSLVGEFESAIKDFLQVADRHVVATSTGSSALHIALIAAGIGAGDEVITPAFNFWGDFQAIIAVGAEPVFCDIDEQTLCIDVDAIEGLLSERTRALIVTDYACMICDHDRLNAIAQKHNLRVIHDAAHSFASKYKGRMIGSFSDIAVFSFDPVKTVTCIDGGAVLVKSEQERDVLMESRALGMQPAQKEGLGNQRTVVTDIERLGFRYHLSNVHAAIGLAQLKKIESLSSERRELARLYSRLLEAVPAVRVPATDFEEITPFAYFIRVDAAHRQPLRDFLQERKIDTGLQWTPGHHYSAFKACRSGGLQETEKAFAELINLPLFAHLGHQSVERVVSEVKRYFDGAG